MHAAVTTSKMKELEGPSDDDLPQSSGVQQVSTELMTASSPAAGKHWHTRSVNR